MPHCTAGGAGHLTGGKRRKTKKSNMSKKSKMSKKSNMSKKTKKSKKSKKTRKTKKSMPKLAKALKAAIKKMGGTLY